MLESLKLQHLVSPALSSLTIAKILQIVVYMGVRQKWCFGFFWALEQGHLWPISRAHGTHPLLLNSLRKCEIWEDSRKKVKWEGLMGKIQRERGLKWEKKKLLSPIRVSQLSWTDILVYVKSIQKLLCEIKTVLRFRSSTISM